MKQQTPSEYIAFGQIPFFRLPVAPVALRPPPRGTRAVVLGVPYDGGATYRPGARLAPYDVRRVSALVQGFHPEHGIAVFDRLRAIDGGNVVFPPFDAAAVRAAIEHAARTIHDAGAVPFVVGGDHGVALPAMRAAARRHGALAVVHVDAHLDTSGPETWGERFHHGTPFRIALEEALIERGHLYHVGIRGPWGSAADAEPGAAHDARVFTADDVGDRGVAAVAAAIRGAVGDRPAYLSFDVDAVDPAFAPGTGTPVPGGLTSREALLLVRGLAGIRLVGADVVEVSPALDHADITSTLAAYVLFEALAVAALAGPLGTADDAAAA